MGPFERLHHIEAECGTVLTRYGAVDILMQATGVAGRYEISFVLPTDDP